MSDPITDLFHKVDAEPDPQFVEQLRSRALAELRAGRVEVVDDTDADPSSEFSVVRTPTSREHPARRWPAIAGIAAVLAVIVGIAVIVGRGPLSRHPVGDGEHGGRGFTASLTGDLALANAAVVHFDAHVALSQAVESDEIGVATVEDVLLTPDVTLRMTTDGSRLDLTSAYVEIFLDPTVATCVVNTGACEPALVRGSVDATEPIEVAPGRPFTLPDSRLPSRIRVQSEAVAAVIEQVSSGSAVTGAAVVISTGQQTASAIFDSAGRRVLDCPGVPDECMDPDRSVLFGETASSVTAAVAPVSAFPLGDAPPGTYSAGAVAVPYTITTSASWQLLASNSATLFLGRTAAFPAQLVVRQGVAPGIATAADAIDHFCPTGAVDFGATTKTTLLSASAVQAEGPVLSECSPTVIAPAVTGNPNRRLSASAGDTIRITAADIDGTVVVVVAVAPTSSWPEFAAELEATTLNRA